MTAYLIYRPVMDYEESETAYLVCLTKERADTVRLEMVKHAKLLSASLESLYDEEGEILQDDDYFTRGNSNTAKIKGAEWPYGINLTSDIPSHQWNCDFDESCIAIREIPLIQNA